MKLKDYYFEFFLDELDNEYIVDKKWCKGYYKCQDTSWKKALTQFVCQLFIELATNGKLEKLEKSTIGIYHTPIKCNDKLVDFNYINRVISKDDDLKKVFYY